MKPTNSLHEDGCAFGSIYGQLKALRRVRHQRGVYFQSDRDFNRAPFSDKSTEIFQSA